MVFREINGVYIYIYIERERERERILSTGDMESMKGGR